MNTEGNLERSTNVPDGLDPRLDSLKEFDNYPEIDSLLLLLSFLGGSNVPKAILLRGCTPRQRWDDFGDVKVITAVEAGLDPSIFAFLSDSTALDQAIQALVSRSLLNLKEPEAGHPTLTLDSHLLGCVTLHLSQTERDKYSVQAWVLACQAFFRGLALEPL